MEVLYFVEEDRAQTLHPGTSAAWMSSGNQIDSWCRS